MASTPDFPVGVFDSGVGGLSILKALRAELPQEDFVYFADSGHAPYGERGAAHVIDRSRHITRQLLERHRIKALVVACNTATAAAIQVLRSEFPDVPMVGVEPALKPAVGLSQTRQIGVMATRGTLASAKFQALLASLSDQATFTLQPCDGLADAIEHHDTTKIEALSLDYTRALGTFGSKSGNMDVLVLGCTHYAFAEDTLRALIGPQVRLIETGLPVAQHTRRVLANAASLRSDGPSGRAGDATYLTTGQPSELQQAVARWLRQDTAVTRAA